jgi:hypothetical protein
MSDEPAHVPEPRMGSLLGRLMIVLAGIIAGQFILYGPSLLGQKILLPLDLLAVENVYLPMTPEVATIVPHDRILADLVLGFEPARQFAISELHAGRLPRWTPYQYAGAPAVTWPKFSPFLMLECCTRSPLILAWTQLFAAVIAGFGVYFFCRRVLSVSFWAAAIPAWCYPMTGFFVFWQGSSPCNAVYWFPWLLLAVDRTVRRASPWAAAGLSVVTGLVLTSGSLDVSGQVLLASGLYAVWCLLDVHRKQWFRRPAQRAVSAVTTGWLLGFLLAAPYLLPLLEYAQTGSRMERRSAGSEERPPVGLSALPQTVLPDMYGATRAGSLRLTGDTQIESSATTYTGILATLLVAPLAWCSRRHRSLNVFWCLLGFFALSWSLNVPGLVALLRLPGLNMMSHNRFVFAASFAILAMTAVGLDVLGQGNVRRRWWFWLPAGLMAGLFAWCLYRTIFLPEPIATQIGLAVNQGKSVSWIHDPDSVRQVKLWFTWSYAVAAMLCDLGIIGWLLLWLRPAWSARAIPVLGILLMGDLLWFAHDRSAQCDPALYYPRIPVLAEIAKSTPGRIVGFSCLPAMLAQTHGLRDIRGDDGVESKRLMDIMAFAADPRSPKINYSMMQWFSPRVDLVPPDGIRLSPILDLLGVRYVIFRGTPPTGIYPAFQGTDYWVLVNHAALPRVFVPQQVEVVTDDHQRLEKLMSPQFDPHTVAYLESPPGLPDSCRGKAEIVSEIPTRVTVSVQMETPGLVVLADLWDKGWKAYLNGQPVPILRADHAVRGVVVPAGATTLEFRYESASFVLGLCLSGLAAVILLGWLGAVVWTRRGPLSFSPPPVPPQNPRSL